MKNIKAWIQLMIAWFRLAVGLPQPLRPGRLLIRRIYQVKAKITAVVKLPVPGALDVDIRELFVSRNPFGASSTIRLPSDAMSYELGGEDGDIATLILTDIDLRGNHSEPSEQLTINFIDTFAPPKPGPLTVESTREG